MNSKLTIPRCLPKLAFIFLLTPVVFLSGCTERVDEVLLGHRKALLKEAEPTGFTTIEVAQKNIDESPSITIEGQADLNEMVSETPRALFLVREILEDDGHGGSSHDPST